MVSDVVNRVGVTKAEEVMNSSIVNIEQAIEK